MPTPAPGAHGYGYSTSSPVGQAKFNVDTVFGSTLLCAVQAQSGATTSGGIVTPTIAVPTTPGLTWTLVDSEISSIFNIGVDNYAQSAIAVFACANAPSVAHTTFTTSSASGSFVEWGLGIVEIQNVASSGVANNSHASGTSASAPAGAGNITVTSQGLIYVFATDLANGAGIVHNGTAGGSGFTDDGSGGGIVRLYGVVSATGTYDASWENNFSPSFNAAFEYLGIAVFMPSAAPPPAFVGGRVISGTFFDLSGEPISNGKLVMRLSTDGVGLGSGSGSQVTVAKFTLSLDVNGAIVGTPTVWANDVLSPSTTSYYYEVYTEQGQLALRGGIVTIPSGSGIFSITG